MKTYLTKAMASVVLATMLFNCSVEPIDSDFNSNVNNNLMSSELLDACDNEDPVVQLTNNGSVNFDLYVYSMVDGSLLNSQLGVSPSSTTDWLDFSSGDVLISLQNSSTAEFKVVHTMETCMQLQLEIAANNTLLPATPEQL